MVDDDAATRSVIIINLRIRGMIGRMRARVARNSRVWNVLDNHNEQVKDMDSPPFLDFAVNNVCLCG